METHPDQDWKQGKELKYDRYEKSFSVNNDLPYQGSNEELLDGLEVCGLGGRKTKEGDGNGKKPGPFPEKRLKKDKLGYFSN